MAALLVGLFIMGVMATVAMPVWTQAATREKETELVFRGEQYARAVGLFQRKMGPGTLPPNLDVLVDQKFLRRKFKDPITGKDFAPINAATAAASGLGMTPGGRGAAGASPGAAGAGFGGVQGGIQGGGGAGGARPGGAQGQGAGGQGIPQGGTLPGGQGGAGTVGQSGLPPGGIVGVVSASAAPSLRLYNGRDHYNQWAFVYNPPADVMGGAAGGVQGGAAGGVGPGGLPRQPAGVPGGAPGGGARQPPPRAGGLPPQTGSSSTTPGSSGMPRGSSTRP